MMLIEWPFLWFTGAVLHVHEGSMLDVHWLIKNATYDPHCFMCTNRSSGLLQFHFFEKPPTNKPAGQLSNGIILFLFCWLYVHVVE